ncbi:MAG: tetratricopeptide repeat protein, partial [Bradymonadaceae bacterium]
MRRPFIILWLGLMLGLMSGLMLGGCASIHDQGMRALQQDDLETAEQHAKRALAQDRHDPGSNLLMARVLVAKDNPRQALPYARRAFESDDLVVEAGRVLGKIHWDLGQPIEAAEVWGTTREHDPSAIGDDDFKRALEAAIIAATLSQDHARALHFRVQFAELAPDHQETSPESFRLNRERLAAEYIHQGRLEDAVQLYEELRAEFADRPFYSLEVGHLLVRLDRRDEAARAWQDYVNAFEGSRRVQRLLEVAGRAEQLAATPLALQFYEEALATMDESEPTFRRATLRLRIAALLFSDNRSERGKEEVLAYL